MIDHQPTYELRCRTCPWRGRFYFDAQLPETCPYGHAYPQKKNLTTNLTKGTSEGVMDR